MQYLLGEDVFCKPPVAQRTNPQQTPLMQKTLAFFGKNHHAASVQNTQQPSAGFLLRFPKGHRQLLPQDTLYHLVKAGIHGVDPSATALLLGLLLLQFLEQGQALVKIIGIVTHFTLHVNREQNNI